MPVVAYVLVRTKPGTSHEVLASRKIRGVKMASSVFGRYDAVLVITAEDMDELSKTVYDVVEKHPNVEHTECLVSIPYPPEEEAHPPSETNTVSSFYCPSCHALNEQGSVFCQSCGFVFKPKKATGKGK
jgi:DNA-binding Lrp family transcriptional regulator